MFYCHEKKEEYFLTIEELLQLILKDELLIKDSENNDNYKNKIISSENIVEINKIKLFRNIYYHSIDKGYSFIKYIYKKYIHLSNEYSSNLCNDNLILKEKILTKIFYIFNKISEILTGLIYCYIIKRFISEQLWLIGSNISQNESFINENLNIAKHFCFPLWKKRLYNSNRLREEFKLLWIIEFYSIEQQKNEKDKATFIGISSGSFVIIYLFLFLIHLKEKKDENDLYQVINYKRIDIVKPQKIKRLKMNFNNLNKENNNYFLISSSLSNKAIIINITENFSSIITIQKINVYNGLISSLEFHYKGNNFLLDATKEISLWYFDEKLKILKDKIIEPKYGKYGKLVSDYFYHRPIIYFEDKSMFIILTVNPIKCVEFFIIDKQNKEFNLILIEKITIKDEEFYLSSSFSNFCIIKKKYLLIGSRRKPTKNKKIGGIYIFNLNNFQFIQHFKMPRKCFINSLINVKENSFLYTTQEYFGIDKTKTNKKGNPKENKNIINIKYQDNIKNYKMIKVLVSCELIEKENGEIILEEKGKLYGNFYSIDCESIISDSFLFCSHKDNNSAIKINEKGKLIHYFTIKSPFVEN